MFREKALEKLDAPERLDERMALIPPRWWMTWTALLAVLCVAALWGWFGSISTKVHGSGMLQELSGFRNVASSSDGIIGYLNVVEGSFVEEGDVLGVVSLPRQQLDLQFHRDKLDLLRKELAEMNEASEWNRAERGEYFVKMRAANMESVAKLEQILDKLSELTSTYEDLSKRGIVTRVESLRMFQDMLHSSIDMTQQQQDAMRTDIEKADYDLNFKREFWQKQLKVMEAEFDLKSRMAEFISRTLITSPTRGEIVNVQKSAGDPVSVGDVVFLLHPAYDDVLYVDAFISAAESQKVREGQLVYVSPSGLEPQRTGYMLGIVEKVERYPATFEQLVNVFKNRDLTQMLKGDRTSVAIKVCLIPHSRNRTGVRWTRKEPSDVRIAAGMICQVAVLVERRPPISYVMPWVRENLLGDTKEAAGTAGMTAAP